MVVLFQDGFETGNFTAWTAQLVNGTTITVVSTVSHHGTYCQQIDGIDANGEYGINYKSISPSVSEMYGRAYVRFTTAFANNTRLSNLVRLGSDTPTWAGLAHTTGTNYQWLGAHDPGLLYTGPNFALVLNRWYCVEVHGVNSTTVGVVEVWVDGVNIISQTGLNTSVNPFYQFALEAYADLGDTDAQRVYHDCAVCSTTRIGCELAGMRGTLPLSRNFRPTNRSRVYQYR